MTGPVKERKPRTAKLPARIRQVIQLSLRCPACRAFQLEHVYHLNDKPWFKCQHCGETSPSDSWRLVFLSSPPLQY